LPPSVENRVGPLFVLAMVAVTLTGPLSIHAFIPALPMVQRDFGMDAATTQFILSVTLFAMAGATLLYGPLSDRHGRRPVLLVGLGLFLIGTLGCALADDFATLVTGRFVQAGGAACGLVLARAIVRDVYGDDRLVKMMAYLTMAYVMGPMIAPVVGGTLADLFDWRAIFHMGLAIGVSVFILTAVATHETAPNIGVRSGGRFVVRDYVRLVRMPRFMGYVLHCGFISASFFATISAASFLMSEVLHRPAAEYGLWFMTLPAGYLLGNFAASRFSGRLSINATVVIGAFIALVPAIGFLIWVAVAPMSPLMLFLPCAIAGLGQGLSMPNAQSGAISVDPDLTGTASGVVMFAHLFLGAVGTQIMGFVADGTAFPVALVFLGFLTLSLIAAIVAVMPWK
jgi:DHA1 family bicyclomycin/chloramphenicol resistance-like MFS transporter